MTPTPQLLRRTPLADVHKAGGAKMVPFAGWEMPVEYRGIIAEHLAVRRAAGLFDVSHMGEFEIEGPGALAFLQRVTCNDVAKLGDGQVQYSALPTAEGTAVDDITLYRRGPERFLMVVNAGNIEKDFRWLQGQGPRECTLADRSDDYALLALQGPAAAGILAGLTETDLAALGYYRFTEGAVAGRKALISRTGYTGEDGFELYIPADAATHLWPALLEAGRDRGLQPVGLGARDTLRLEAKMCLYGQDIDETTSLIEAGLSWIVSTSPEKGDYPGRAVLAAQKAGGAPRKLVGFEMVGRGIARHGYPVIVDGAPFGTVTSGSHAPFLEKSIGLCYLPPAKAAAGTDFGVEIRGRVVEARVVPTPFYKRAK